MKIPQHIEGIYREGRTDFFTSTNGVEPLWLGAVGRIGRGVWKKRKCIAKCALVSGWGRRAACVAQC